MRFMGIFHRTELDVVPHILAFGLHPGGLDGEGGRQMIFTIPWAPWTNDIQRAKEEGMSVGRDHARATISLNKSLLRQQAVFSRSS